MTMSNTEDEQYFDSGFGRYRIIESEMTNHTDDYVTFTVHCEPLPDEADSDE